MFTAEKKSILGTEISRIARQLQYTDNQKEELWCACNSSEKQRLEDPWRKQNKVYNCIINNNYTDSNDDDIWRLIRTSILTIKCSYRPFIFFSTPLFYVTLRYVHCELAGGSLLFSYAHCEMLSRAKLRGTRMECSMGVLSLTPTQPSLSRAPSVKQLTVPPTRDYCTHSYRTRSSVAYVQPVFPFRVVHFPHASNSAYI